MRKGASTDEHAGDAMDRRHQMHRSTSKHSFARPNKYFADGLHQDDCVEADPPIEMYSKSSRIHSLKSRMLLRPLTCQRQVMPGLTRSLCFSRSLYCAYSVRSGGRGPTRLKSPFTTLNKLRDLVEAVAAHPGSQPGNAWIARNLEHRAGHFVLRHEIGLHLVGIHHHGAELVTGERDFVLPHPVALEEDRTPRSELDGNGEQHAEWRQNDQCRQRKSELHRSA